MIFSWDANNPCNLHFKGSEVVWDHLAQENGAQRDGYFNRSISSVKTDVQGTPKSVSSVMEPNYIQAMGLCISGPTGIKDFVSYGSGGGRHDASDFCLNASIDRSLLTRVHDDFAQIVSACRLLFP